MDYINQQGETEYLKCTPEVLHSHLRMGKTVRPLLLNKTPDEVNAFIREQLVLREPYYRQAKHTLDVVAHGQFRQDQGDSGRLKQMLGLD
jgi:shikimate kinase